MGPILKYIRGCKHHNLHPHAKNFFSTRGVVFDKTVFDKTYAHGAARLTGSAWQSGVDARHRSEPTLTKLTLATCRLRTCPGNEMRLGMSTTSYSPL
jgi:hypothetical protein